MKLEVNQRDKLVQELQHKLKEEREQIDKIIENNVDKRAIYDLEKKFSLLQEKNRALYAEVINSRKQLESKDAEMEKAQLKASQLEKKLVLAQRQIQQQQVMIKSAGAPQVSQYVMPF